MRVETQFSAFLVNKPGVLAQITRRIAKAKLNIIAMTLVDSSEHGVLRFVCDNPDEAREVLSGGGEPWTETEVLVMTLENEPGELATVAETMAEEHINISYGYTSGGAPGGHTTCVFKVADLRKAQRLLGKYARTETDMRPEKIRPSYAHRR